ncbi:hypothetical protein [Parabacteroides sp. PF5-9]|uniref:hypothetical protein n=1 Tax=Parabacteroides sp. PF5-9 TaxID=1742404 RepID=UPI002475ED5B|nr:hypothetical protein [Parabacteroides sp. PF5-9]
MKQLFKQLPEKQLPADFRSAVMQQVMAETVRLKKRNERFGFIAVLIASVCMIALAIMALIFHGIPKISIQLPSVIYFSFYGFIGICCLFLLFLDYFFRKKFKEKQDSFLK